MTITGHFGQLHSAHLPHALPLPVPDYVGCFFFENPVIRNESQGYPQWIEPQHMLFGGHYPTYARGSAYMLSYQAASWISLLPPKSLRYFRSEGAHALSHRRTFKPYTNLAALARAHRVCCLARAVLACRVRELCACIIQYTHA